MDKTQKSYHKLLLWQKEEYNRFDKKKSEVAYFLFRYKQKIEQSTK